MKTKDIFTWLIATAVIVGGVTGLAFYNTRAVPGTYDTLAQCLTDKGVKFYGAFWCPHCQNEKAMFGNSARLLPYVECSTPDGKDQTQVCKDEKIEGYPTWVFPDDSRLSGEIKPEDLATKAGCPTGLATSTASTITSNKASSSPAQ